MSSKKCQLMTFLIGTIVCSDECEAQFISIVVCPLQLGLGWGNMPRQESHGLPTSIDDISLDSAMQHNKHLAPCPCRLSILFVCKRERLREERETIKESSLVHKYRM